MRSLTKGNKEKQREFEQKVAKVTKGSDLTLRLIFESIARHGNHTKGPKEDLKQKVAKATKGSDLTLRLIFDRSRARKSH